MHLVAGLEVDGIKHASRFFFAANESSMKNKRDTEMEEVTCVKLYNVFRHGDKKKLVLNILLLL